MPAVSLEKSGTVLANQSVLYVECFYRYVTIVVLNLEDDPVLIFPTNAVSQMTQISPTEISLNIATNADQQVLYKFAFPNALLATVWNDLLRTECRQLASRTYTRQPNSNPLYEQLFNQVYQSIQSQKKRN